MRSRTIEYPSDDDLVDIYAEFNATKESVQRDVEYLIKWIEQQPHLPNIKDEEFLANFLIRCKNSLERTKSRLSAYYVCKASMPDIFSNRSSCKAEIFECWKVIQLVPLPKLTPDKQRVIIHAISPNVGEIHFTPELIMKLYTIVWDVGLKADTCKGYIFVYDFANVTVSFNSVLLSTWRMGVQLLKNGPPIRLFSIYVLNLLPVFQPLVNFGLTLIPQKLADRIIIWPKNSTDLAEVLPKSVLPSNYGGDEMPTAELKDALFNLIDDYREWFESSENDKADLSKVPKPSDAEKFDSNSLLGTQGSFRKLVLD